MKVSLVVVLGICLITGLEMLPKAATADGIHIEAVKMVKKLESPELKELPTIEKIPVGFEALMLSVGATSEELPQLNYIFGQESGFCATKWENQRTCPDDYPGDIYSIHDKTKGYGLCQATPAIKYESAGSDWRTNEATQAKWCLQYARTYGSVEAAAKFKSCVGKCYSTRTNSKQHKVTPWF